MAFLACVRDTRARTPKGLSDDPACRATVGIVRPKPVEVSMSVSDADLRRCLNAFRERYLVPKYPGTRREEGLLRRAMVDFLVEARPPSAAAFRATAPEWLTAGTS